MADAAAAAYGELDAGRAFQHTRFAGGHPLTEERFAFIVQWTVAHAS